MDTQTIINKIATLVGLDKQVKLAGDVYGKLEDGTAVATDSFQVGNVLFVISEAGNKALAPDADHKIYLPTENGSKLYQITTKDGIMTQIELQPNPGKELNMKQENLAENSSVGVVTSPKPKEDNMVDPAMLPNVKSELAVEDVASRMDEMAAEIKQLRDDIANIYSKMEPKEKEEMEQDMSMESYNEDAKVKDILKGGVGVGGQGKPNDGGPSKYNMSAQKKFTGAPVEEAKPLAGLLRTNKTENAMTRVFAKMANSKI
jgi:hypothetical protein